MAGMILKDDPVTKVRKVMHADPYTGDGYVETEQDVTDLIELNKAHYAMFDERARCAKDGEMVASIPITVYWNLPRHIREDEKEFRKWLDAPEQRHFRTHPTKLSKASQR